MLHRACAIREVPGRGKGIVALQPISAGEIVIEEEPLLSTGDVLPEVAMLGRQLRVDPALLMVAVAFGHASTAVQEAVLSLYCPGEAGHESSSYWEAACAGAAAAPRLAAISGCPGLLLVEERQLRRVLLTWNLTAHSFRNCCSAVFSIGGRLNHSCDQNTQYLSHNETANSARWVARRDIAVGEEVTTSYMMRNDALPVRERQAFLQEHYWFKCTCDRCTRGIDVCGQLPCPRCYPAARDASGKIKDARKVGKMDKESFTFTFHDVLTTHYIGCDMGRLAAGHPRPWVCGHCGAEVEDTAEALFPAALLRSKPWGQGRPDWELTREVVNLERAVDSGLSQTWSPVKAFRLLDSLYDDALGVLGFKHFAVYRLVQLQAEFSTQKLMDFDSPEFGMMSLLLRQGSVASLVGEAQRKWAMLHAMCCLLGREGRDFLSFFSLKLLAAVRGVMPVASAGPRAAGPDAVAAARLLAAQLIRLQVRYYALKQPEADPGAEETLELLSHWAALQAMTINHVRPTSQVLVRDAVERAMRLGDVGWMMLGRPLEIVLGSGRCVRLFDSSEEADKARAWLGAR